MAALDFPASPTVGQTYTPPSGAVYTWDGTVWTLGGPIPPGPWTDTGTTLTPTNPARSITTGNSTPAGVGFITGSTTVKNRIRDVGAAGVQVISNSDGTNNDDASKASWLLQLNPGNDAYDVYRAPASAASAYALKIRVDGAGVMTLPANGDPLITMGGGTMKGGITVDSAGQITMQSNHPWQPTDTTKSSWMLSLQPTGDQAVFYRRAPGAGTGTVTIPFRLANDNKLYCTLADTSVNRAMLAGGMTNNAQAAAIATNFSCTTYNSWVLVATFPAIATKGNRIFLTAGPCLSYNCLGSSGNVVGQLFRRSGTDVGGSGAWTAIGVTGTTPLPTHQAQDQPAAGTYTYTYWIYLTGTGNPSITAHANGGAWCWATEVP